ncbi:polyadenylate-binding protein RBP47-like [Tasmannia lanceolata]|uniref:polyadenylate-binding protein RBP47-like n=1 Tax=Tasmannia lanceolata TaxID=3420 RepID=UPI004062B0A2
MMQSTGGGDPHQQQWMAMMMPQHYPQQFMPFHHHQQQVMISSSSDENKTIWIGDLHYWMDENYLHNCFAHTGEVISIKVIRNKQTGQSEGYGFVEFLSHAAAEKVLQTYTGTAMPNTDQPFRLNWASFSMGDRRSDVSSDRSIFVGDLAPDVTDTILQETFTSRYPSVKGAKVVIDANTGRSKGYGFVRFGDDNERSRAMTEMNGAYCSSRPMRIGVATPRKSSQQSYSSQGGFTSNGASAQGFQSDGDSSNTTIFVGGLDPNTSDEYLRQAFSQYGDIVSVKIPVGKGCGFVQFAQRSDAEEALQGLNGTVIGKQTVRLSWGRNPANKQPRADPGNQWNGAYYGGQSYDGSYGYAMAPQDPSMYAAYGAYPVYGNPQQQVS